MCGIAGKIYFNKTRIDKNKEIPFIEKILTSLYHRGPDAKGYIIDDNVWLGSTRLAIIDLSKSANQPLSNEDNTVFLIFNGEIYNYLEISRRLRKRHRFISNSDSEVIIHLYEEYGVNCLKYLRGMFAFAIWDKRKKELFIARDRIGKKPLKYYFDDKFFIFASELKAFINHSGVPKEVDWDAIDEFLTYQYVPAPKTGFKNIWKLPPAHYMLITSDGSIRTKLYWDINFSEKLNINEEELTSIVENKLIESVQLRLQSDVPLGIHLSGGIDSGLITAISAQQKSDRLNTYSVGFSEEEFSELRFSRIIANRYNTKHHEIIMKYSDVKLLPEIIYQYEEPFADPSIIPTWLLMKSSKKDITVALNGDGGDEDFAGYNRYKVTKLYSLLKDNSVIRFLLTKFYNYYPFQKPRRIVPVIKKLFPLESDISRFYFRIFVFLRNETKKNLYSQHFKQMITNNSFNFIKTIFTRTKQFEDDLDKVLYADMKSYLPETLLQKADIASMAHSLEIRSPFLDHEFIELIAKISSDYKLRFLTSKYILKNIAAKYLPEECYMREKQGFVPPLKLWFKKELYQYVTTTVLRDKYLCEKVFDRNSLITLIDDNLSGKSDNTYIIWSIICLSNWFKVWFNSDKII